MSFSPPACDNAFSVDNLVPTPTKNGKLYLVMADFHRSRTRGKKADLNPNQVKFHFHGRLELW
jgi:hypothetical protein